MSIPLTGTGGLFTRVGLLLGNLNAYNTWTATTTPPYANDIQAQFQSTDQNLIDGLYNNFGAYQSSGAAWPQYLQQLARNVVVQMVNEAAPQPNTSLQQALTALIAQMVADGDSVLAATLTDSVTSGGSNVGNPVWVVSLKLPNGLSAQNSFAETLTATTIADAQFGGGAAVNQQVINILGEAAVQSGLSPLYPAGSGANVNVTLINPNATGSLTANNLKNGNFETWTTANTPDNFVIETGTAGVQVLRSATAYTGTYALSYVGDAATNTSIYQEFGQTSTGTPNNLQPLTQVAVNLFCKVDIAPAAGVLQVALVDGSGTVVNDQNGVANSFTVNLVTVGTSYVAKNATFRTPADLPSTLRLRLKLTTPLSAGSVLLMDNLTLAIMSPLYPQGPSVSVFAADTQTVRGDTWTVDVTNDRTIDNSFQLGFQKFFSMMQLGLLLPVDASPTISAALITV